MQQLRDALFAPASVAIVGQSDDAGKAAGRPLKFLRQTGYAGRVYPINPRRESVLGERAWPSLAALPEAPDHAYIVTPTEAAVAAVEECGRLGVKVATVLADGFAEAGAEGLAREARLRDACARTGIRVVGPSSLGVVDLRTKSMLTANAALDTQDLPVGRIFAASHSGSLIGALLTRGKARGVGFAGLVSVGNEVDLSLGEICAATLDDPGIDGYMLFLETMRHADALQRFAVAAAARGGARKAVGVVTTTAGGATMVIDPLARRGVTIAPASSATLGRLAAAGITARPARLVDLTVAGARYEIMKSALAILLEAPEFDLLLAVVGSSGRTQPEATVRPIIEGAAAGKPLAAFVVPEAPEALALLSRAGLPSFRTPEACADAIAAALSRRAPRPLTACSSSPAPEDGRVLDELAAGDLLDRIGIARAPAVALDAGIVRPPPLPFPYPVAVKVLSAEFAHKTDVGGVVLDVADGAALCAAIGQIRKDLAERMPGASLARVLVQPMLSGLGEVLVGYRVDRDVGPLIMVAAGGIWAETLRDRSLRLAPVDLDAAREMIFELRSLAPLAGDRGRPKGDLDALARAIVALSRLADHAEVVEAEINPLIVRPAGEGVVAVDALVKLRGRA